MFDSCRIGHLNYTQKWKLAVRYWGIREKMSIKTDCKNYSFPPVKSVFQFLEDGSIMPLNSKEFAIYTMNTDVILKPKGQRSRLIRTKTNENHHWCTFSCAQLYELESRSFLTSGHSDAQGWASECPDVKKLRLSNSYSWAQENVHQWWFSFVFVLINLDRWPFGFKVTSIFTSVNSKLRTNYELSSSSSESTKCIYDSQTEKHRKNERRI